MQVQNLSGSKLTLKTTDGKTDVVKDVDPQSHGDREINPVKVNLALFDGSKKVSDLKPVTLARGEIGLPVCHRQRRQARAGLGQAPGEGGLRPTGRGSPSPGIPHNKTGPTPAHQPSALRRRSALERSPRAP